MKLYKSILCFASFLILGINMCMSQINERFSIDSTQLTFEQKHGFDVISFSGCSYSTETGKPLLPVKTLSYVVPFQSEVKGITLHSVSVQKMSGTFNLMPVQPSQVTDGSPSIDFLLPDSSVYYSDTLYPTTEIEIISDEYTFGYHVVTIKIYPISYNTQTKELYLRTFNYSIEYISGNTTKKLELLVQKQSYNRSVLTEKHIKNLVCNPNKVIDFADKTVLIQDEYGSVKATGTRKASDATNISNTLIPDYIIITNEQLKPVFQRLAKWKTRKGIPTIIQTTEFISNHYQGCDLAEKIRYYLKEVYSSWGAGIFILLGGDTNIIPARMVTSNHDHISLRPSDLYFAAIDETWNANKNTVFFESTDNVDYGRDFYLGRASVEDSIEAGVFVNKVIKYENVMNVSDSSYVRNVMVCSAFLSKYDYCDYFLDDEYHQKFKNYCNSILGHAAWYLFDNADCSDSRFLYSPVVQTQVPCPTNPIHNAVESLGSCINGDENLNRINFCNALSNNNLSNSSKYFHIIYHLDHSSELTLGTSYRGFFESATCVDMDNLSNGNNLQILFTSGCKPCTFSQDCLGEHYINNPNGGGVAFIGNTDVGYYDYYDQCQQFLAAIYNSDIHNLAYAFYCASDKNNRRWRTALLGDPEMQVWSDTPQNLSVSINHDSIYSYSDTMFVTISNLQSGNEAYICLQKEDELYAVKTVSENGTYLFPLKLRTSGKLNVTVTSHNYKPFLRDVPVNINSSNHVFIADILIDDSSADCVGNGDQQIDAGETIGLNIKLTNIGSSVAHNVTATLLCNSEYLEFLSSQSDFGDIQMEDTVMSISKYRFSVDELAPEVLKNDLNPIVFSLLITDSLNILYTDTFRIAIYAPDLIQANKTILSTSDGDLLIEQGEIVTFSVDLFNKGKAEAIGVSGVLSSNSANVNTCINTPQLYSDIDENTTKTNVSGYQFTVDDSYQTGDDIFFNLEVENEYGKTWSYSFNLMNKPEKIESDSISFTSTANSIILSWTPNIQIQGYNIYRSAADSSGGDTHNYIRVNTFLSEPSYYEDYDLEYGGYYYKIAAVSIDGNEGPLSDSVYTWISTSCKQGYPTIMTDMFNLITSINVEDIDGDGRYEIFASGKMSEDFAKIVGLYSNGFELFDIDHDLNFNRAIIPVGANLDTYPAVGELNNDGIYSLVFGTRAEDGVSANYFASYALNSSAQIITKQWLDTVPTSYLTYRSPMIANIDNSADGSQEIIYICDNGYMKVCSSNNVLLWTKWLTGGIYGASAVADLDGDGTMEIAVPTTAGLYVWNHDGSNYSSSQPLYHASDYVPRGSVIICDLDNDGDKELLLAAIKGTYSCTSRIIALHHDGTIVSGWDTVRTIASSSSISQEISVGDVNSDGRLEVVALGKNIIKVWSNEGQLLSNIAVSLTNDKHTPILADVDGDSDMEIVYTNQNDNHVYAININGNPVNGFPLITETNIQTQDPCVVDIDANGKNDVIVASGDKVYAWETNGSSNIIAWRSERFDAQNTGNFSACVPVRINKNTTWSDSLLICGDIYIQNDTLTIDSTCVLNMIEGSTLYILSDGTLNISGGCINNANIISYSGSNIIQDHGTINLSATGKFVQEHGSKGYIRKGEILVSQ